jgi:hypothetical protein
MGPTMGLMPAGCGSASATVGDHHDSLSGPGALSRGVLASLKSALNHDNEHHDPSHCSTGNDHSHSGSPALAGPGRHQAVRVSLSDPGPGPCWAAGMNLNFRHIEIACYVCTYITCYITSQYNVLNNRNM